MTPDRTAPLTAEEEAALREQAAKYRYPGPGSWSGAVLRLLATLDAARAGAGLGGLREAVENVCRVWFDEVVDEPDPRMRQAMVKLRAALRAASPTSEEKG